MNQVSLPAKILGELIAKCTQGQLNEKSWVTIEDDGKHYKILTTQPGGEKILSAIMPIESNIHEAH